MKGFAGTSYDEVPYMAASFSNTHPEVLAVTTLLRGLDPPPLANARVLELGCARGANLVPMAWSMPGAEFVGVDLSRRQIEEARELASGAGATNVVFHAMDLRDLDESFGPFDYIVGHGLYSWVPPDVQDAILEVCSKRLSPDGIVYLSYNVFPGWHVSVMFREMMLYRIRNIPDPAERLREVRGFMRFLADSTKSDGGLWSILLDEQASYVEQAKDWYLLHDDLEAENNPVYFSEMIERVARHGLQYVTEERWGTPDEILSPEVWEVLDRFATTRIEREQYLDFLRNARFRRSLFCHAGLPLATGPVPDRLERCRFRALVRPVDPAADPFAPGEERFAAAGTRSLTTATSRLRALLHALYDVWPGTLDYASVTRDPRRSRPPIGRRGAAAPRPGSAAPQGRRREDRVAASPRHPHRHRPSREARRRPDLALPGLPRRAPRRTSSTSRSTSSRSTGSSCPSSTERGRWATSKPPSPKPSRQDTSRRPKQDVRRKPASGRSLPLDLADLSLNRLLAGCYILG